MTDTIKRTDIMKFADHREALEAAARRRKPHAVVLGDADDPRPYWLVTFGTAKRLEAAGYERA